jgi:hypothetical protein
MDEPTKRCTRCSAVKLLTEFGKKASGLMGRRSQCKACECEYQRQYAKDHYDATIESMRRYREANREALREAGRQRYAADPEAGRESQRRYREANLEVARENWRRWNAANLEAGRERVRRRTAHMQALVFNHYGWRCACCGTTKALSIDHVNGDGKRHRETLFGRSNESTMLYLWLIRQGFPPGFQTLCRPCNAIKAGGAHCRLAHLRHLLPVT